MPLSMGVEVHFSDLPSAEFSPASLRESQVAGDVGMTLARFTALRTGAGLGQV